MLREKELEDLIETNGLSVQECVIVECRQPLTDIVGWKDAVEREHPTYKFVGWLSYWPPFMGAAALFRVEVTNE